MTAAEKVASFCWPMFYGAYKQMGLFVARSLRKPNNSSKLEKSKVTKPEEKKKERCRKNLLC